MKTAPRNLGLHPALLGVAVLLLMAGCTLSGSSGLGDVTPVPGGDEAAQPTLPAASPTTAPLPTAIPPTATSALSELEALGTQAALTATAQAAGGGAAGEGEAAGEGTLAPAATSAIGGEILPPTNTPVGTPVPAAAASCPPTHTVAQGENMYRIALRYGTTYQELAAANGIANPDQISVGLVLNIPSCGGAAAPATGITPGVATGTTHVVQPGENLYRIALQYNMTWTALAAANGISNPNLLVVGQVLQIPQ